MSKRVLVCLMAAMLFALIRCSTRRASNPSDCGVGTSLHGGRCEIQATVPALSCGAGTVAVDGACVPKVASAACGQNTVIAGGECIGSTVACSSGMSLNTQTRACEVPGTLVCGPGTTKRNGQCLPTAEVMTCAAGTRLEGGRCVPDDNRFACGPGTAPIDGQCVAAARVQVIHNAAAPGLAMLDVYLNGTKASTLAFRSATPYLIVPIATSAVQSVEVAPSGEAPTGHASVVPLGDVRLPFAAGQDYVVMAATDDNGTQSTADDAARLTLYVLKGKSQPSGGLELQVVHAGADMAPIDVGGATALQWQRQALASNLDYGEALAGYVRPDAAWLSLARSTGDAHGFYATAALTAQATHVVATSGYALVPADAESGRGFAVLAFPSNGGAGLEMAQAGAQVQVINETATSLTVTVSGTPMTSGLAYRRGSHFAFVPPSFALDVNAGALTAHISVDAAEKTALVLSSATGALAVFAVRHVSAPSSDTDVALRFAHAAAALQTIDVSADPVNTPAMRVADGMARNSSAAAVSTRAQTYDLSVFAAGAGPPSALQFNADFSAYDGQAVIVTVSGSSTEAAALVAYDANGVATVFDP